MRRRLLIVLTLVAIGGYRPMALGTTTVLPPGLTEIVVSSDLYLPTGFTFTPDRRILIIEKGGAIKLVQNGTTTLTARIAVSAQYDETGLLGITVDPDFAKNGYVYVYYTTSPQSYQPPGHEYRFAWNRVSRFTMIGDSINTSTEVVILDDIFADTEDTTPSTIRHGAPHTGHHNAGCVLFGPDGKLYVSVGDAANGPNAQNLGVLNGKILRINADGAVPPDNPFVSTPGARPEIWCLGLRNPWRFTFDQYGTMFIGDVGLDKFEEINVGGPGLNFGWPYYEGFAGDPAFVDPLYAYPNDQHNTAIAAVGAQSAMGVYPPPYSNVLFFGDFGQGLIYTLRQDPSLGVVVTLFASKAGSPVGFAQGPDGHMYYLSIIPGELRRIDVASGLVPIQLSSNGAGVIRTDPEGLSCGIDCVEFPPGQVVTLKPSPLDGFAFAGWNGRAECETGRITVAAGVSCFANFQEMRTNPLVTQRGVDFSGDGTGDAFFYNATSGEWSLAYSSGAGRFNVSNGRWSPNWTIAPADLNGSPLTDFFLYNRDTGRWVTALATTSGGFYYTSGTFSPGWIVRTGRFDNDAFDDLLLYNPNTGDAFECLSDGNGGFSKFVKLTLYPQMDIYSLDANGDGLKDVLLHAPSTGQWILYLNSGTNSFAVTSGAWSQNFQATVGDFNGNGSDDLFLYDPVDGRWITALSIGNGQFKTQSGNWSPGWAVARARLRGGMQDDLFLYNAVTGQWFECFTDGNGGFSRYYTERWSPGWKVFPTDLNGDGADDLLLYNDATGIAFQCITSQTGGIASYFRLDLKTGYTVIATR